MTVRLFDVLVQVARVRVSLAAVNTEQRLHARVLALVYLQTVLGSRSVVAHIASVLRVTRVNAPVVNLKLAACRVDLLADLARKSLDAVHLHVVLLKLFCILAVGSA